MNDINSLSHTKWECKYHVTWIPKYLRNEIYGDLRVHLDDVFRELARRADCEILEGHLFSDHSDTLMYNPPKHSVSIVIGFLLFKMTEFSSWGRVKTTWK
jgi:putative transposase